MASAKKNLLTKLGNTIHVEVESFSRLVGGTAGESAEFREIARVLEHVDFAHSELIEMSALPSRAARPTRSRVCGATSPWQRWSVTSPSR